MTYYRICIETLLPPSQCPDPIAGEHTHAVDRQYPVSPWLEVPEWYEMSQAIRKMRPIYQVGLIYGFQEKKDGAAYRLEERIAETKEWKTAADIDAWVAKRDSRKQAVFDSIVQSVDAFVAGFDFAAYGLARVLDEAAK